MNLTHFDWFLFKAVVDLPSCTKTTPIKWPTFLNFRAYYVPWTHGRKTHLKNYPDQIVQTYKFPCLLCAIG